jgi:hypothetical protein
VEVLKIGRWFCILLLAGFLVFDLCGRKPAPLPTSDDVAAAAATGYRGPRGGPTLPAGEPVTFEQIGDFACAWPPRETAFVAPAVPDEVRALEGRRIVIGGYALPTAIDGDLATAMLLCRYDAGCCYGGVPKPNEILEVILADGVIRLPPHEPVIMSGVLRIRDAKTQDDLTSGLYILEDARRVERPDPASSER